MSKRKDSTREGQPKASVIQGLLYDQERCANKQQNVYTVTNEGQTNTSTKTDTCLSDVKARTSENAYHYDERPLPKLPTTTSIPLTTQPSTAPTNTAAETNSDPIHKKADVQLSDVHVHTTPGNMLRTSACSEDDVYEELVLETTSEYHTLSTVTTTETTEDLHTPLSTLAITQGTRTTTQPVIVSASVTNQERSKYISLDKDDFFQYTVNETAHCFKHISLGKVADLCHEHRLDGSFFNGLDLEELKKDPFNITHVDVLKVRQLIYNGWRPSI